MWCKCCLKFCKSLLVTELFFPGEKKVFNLGIYHIIVHDTTFCTISERLKRVRTKVWLFVCCDFATTFSRANVCHKNFGFTVKKYTLSAFTGKKNEVSEAILKNFGTFCISTAYPDSAQRSSLIFLCDAARSSLSSRFHMSVCFIL